MKNENGFSPYFPNEESLRYLKLALKTKAPTISSQSEMVTSMSFQNFEIFSKIFQKSFIFDLSYYIHLPCFTKDLLT